MIANIQKVTWNKRLKIFLLLFYATAIGWAASVAFCETQQRVFFAAGQDMFADFFYNVRYVAGRDPYFDTTVASSEHIYPPICYLIFYPFACLYRLCGTINLAEDGLPVFWSNPIAMISCSLFMFFSAIPLVWVVWRIIWRKVSAFAGMLLLLSLLLSGIMMFSFERGNLIVLAASALAVFMVRNDDSNEKTNAGGAWLSLAVSMKIYPVLFVSLLIRKRRFGQVVLVALFTAALGFLPLLFFKHGILENALQLMQNVKAQGTLYYNACPPNLSLSAYVAAAATVLDMNWLVFMAKVLRYGMVIIGVFSLLGIWVTEEKWKRWFLVATAATLCSNFATYYTLLYFIPAIYSYLSSSDSFRRVDWLYSVSFTILLTPLQFGLFPVRSDSVNPFVGACIIVVVAIVILIEGVVKILVSRWARMN